MSGYLGLDTSNYTTSAAYWAQGADKPVQAKQLLPVKMGEMGLRQSDAVFHHTRQLPDVMERLTEAMGGGVAAVNSTVIFNSGSVDIVSTITSGRYAFYGKVCSPGCGVRTHLEWPKFERFNNGTV